MITADFVNDLILAIVEKFKDEDEHTIRRYRTEVDDEEEDVECNFILDNEVKTALECLNIKHKVGAARAFSSYSVDAYAICVSFVVNNELYQRIFVAMEY